MRARYYDPASGRFISKDPSEPNLYAYCRNNPINAIDPDGRASVSVESFINWVADMGGWDMASIYLATVAAALGELGTYLAVAGKVMETKGQFFQAPWLEARGAVIAGDGGLLRVAAGFLAAASVICSIFGGMDDPDAAAYAADYLTSAASVSSLFGGGWAEEE